MKDITVLLLHYSDHNALQRAWRSLDRIKERVKTVIPIDDHDLTMNDTLKHLESTYVMFLANGEYLSSFLDPTALHLTHPHAVLTQCRRPLLVKTELFKDKKFLSSSHLPFKEALLPFWLRTIDEDEVVAAKASWVKTANKNNGKTEQEKSAFLQKLDQPREALPSPTISIIISCYNMASYVGAALASCIFQHTPPEQMLIIDDGSEDDSYQQIKQWQDQPHVDIFQKENEGKAQALNDLLPYVTSDFVMEVDADDWLDPDAISIIKRKLPHLPTDVSLLYGNFRKWKQLSAGDVLYKSIAKGKAVHTQRDLLSYRFPLGPRIYRTSSLRNIGGFPVVPFEDGRLYEDVSVLLTLIKNTRFSYQDFTVYNAREHDASITQRNRNKWPAFKKQLFSN